VNDPVIRPCATPLYASNGMYGVVLTPAGTGFSVYGDYLLTSWNDDPVEDDLGVTIYLHDRENHALWTTSGAALPGTDPGTLIAAADAAELARCHAGIESRLRVQVCANVAAERRWLTLRNIGTGAREIEVTACLELVLNDPKAHASHPGFSKLFVQTRWCSEPAFLVATRRPRSNEEHHPALAFGLTGAPTLEWETDRARFLGRGRGPDNPRAIAAPGPLSGTCGNVLDAVLAVRTRVRLEPGGLLELGCVLAVAERPEGLAAVFRAAARGAAAPVTPIAGADDVEPNPATLLASRLLSRWCTGAAKLRAAAPALGEPTPGRQTPHGDDARGAVGTYGNFSADGREYVISLRREADGYLRLPPMPWINVIANEQFGCFVSEKGAGATWAHNSRLHRLTPWRNDPVRDPHDDALYVRDEASGIFWSALPGPAPGADVYEVRHGFGYTRWLHRSHGLEHAAVMFVPRNDPVRIVDLALRNPGSSPRRLAVYAYNRWVLGASPAETRAQIRVTFDATRGAVLAENRGATPYAGAIAFAAFAGVEGHVVSATTDRAAFLGRPGHPAAPGALRSGGALSVGTGPCHDPCAAIRVELTIGPGEECDLQMLLGEAGSLSDLDQLLREYRRPGAAAAALDGVSSFWVDCLTRVQVHTPVPAIDLMVNGWLLYQTLACRLWARTALYQSGGAFGFRDQLQDSAAFALSQPAYLRTQILANAAQQFVEGDVLHWWHPPDSLGIRTRFADDLVWLPYLTARYVCVTGDESILGERVDFLTAAELGPDEDEMSVVPDHQGEPADLYEHCVRALRRAMTAGSHGLPLFGSGDWNDGMNRVGRQGRGESVWMAFFLCAAIGDFLPLCAARRDVALGRSLTAYRDAMRTAIDEAGWDGEWYRRGYYDNGTVLGSRASEECQIDALVQAWAVISKTGPPARQKQALDAVEQRLVSVSDGLIRLLAPPFVSTPEDPGYIKGYVAGVRENGGQYTHAALWVVRAFAEAGRRDRAARLLEMLSPVTRSAADVERYQVEPYVVAADVYGVDPHVGRGGWTWYTGSAGWMYRVAVESLLGFDVQGGTFFTLAPRIPDEWPGFTLTHRELDGTCYEIRVTNPERHAGRVVRAVLDGQAIVLDGDAVRVPVVHDGRRHEVLVTLGVPQAAAESHVTHGISPEQ